MLAEGTGDCVRCQPGSSAWRSVSQVRASAFGVMPKACFCGALVVFLGILRCLVVRPWSCQGWAIQNSEGFRPRSFES